MTLQTVDVLGAYLEESELINYEHPALAAWDAGTGPEENRVRRALHFVRDEIAHSWDIGSRRVTAKASEVLEHGEGICYAKSHLLAALLRRQGIASGVCYQRLTLGDTPDTGYAIHALNTVYLSERQQWIRLDARGNKPGVQAQFSVDAEQLAYPVRPEMDERDYQVNYALPHSKIAATLAAHDDCRLMYAHGLPTEL